MPAALFFLAASSFNAANYNNDSLLLVLKNSKEDSARVKTLNFLFLNAIKTGDYAKALSYAQTGLKLAELLKYERGVSFNISNIGIVHFYLGNHSEALRYYFLSLKRKEKAGDKRGMSNTQSNIANVLRIQKNFDESEKYYRLALLYYLERGDSINDAYANILENLGSLKATQSDFATALHFYERALILQKTINDSEGIANSLSNTGTAKDGQRKFEEGLADHRQALKIYTDLGEKREQGIAYFNIGYNLFQQKKMRPAQENLLKSISLSTEIGDKEGLKECYFVLQQVFSATQKFKEALQYYKLFVIYRDSLSNEESTKKSVQTQMQYEFDKKSAADSIKNLEAKRVEEINHQSQIRNQKLYTYAGLAGFLVMIIVAAVSLIAFRNKKKATIEIARQKHLVDEKQKEILDSIYYARRIQKALITNEKYIERRLKDLRKN